MVCATTTPVDSSIFETLLQAVRRRTEAEYHTPDGSHFFLCFTILPPFTTRMSDSRVEPAHYPLPITHYPPFHSSMLFFVLPGLNADHSAINLDR